MAPGDTASHSASSVTAQCIAATPIAAASIAIALFGKGANAIAAVGDALWRTLERAGHGQVDIQLVAFGSTGLIGIKLSLQDNNLVPARKEFHVSQATFRYYAGAWPLEDNEVTFIHREGPHILKVVADQAGTIETTCGGRELEPLIS